jgi:hypothetical protein
MQGRAGDYEVVVQPPQVLMLPRRSATGLEISAAEEIVYKIPGSFAEPGQANQEPPVNHHGKTISVSLSGAR